MEKKSPRTAKEAEKSQLKCMWGLMSSLNFGQNHRKQKLLTNGKAAAKHVTGNNPRKLDALTYFSDRFYGFEDGAEVDALGVHTSGKRIKSFVQEEVSGDMQKNTRIVARNEQHKEVDYGLFDDMISKYKPSSKKTRKNQSPLYNWKDTETLDFQQASGSAEMSLCKSNLSTILEAISCQILQENGNLESLDEIGLQVLQTSAKTFIDHMFIDGKYIGKGSPSYEPEQFSNALETLNSNGDLFLKLLQDPSSLLAKQIRHLQSVQIARTVRCSESEGHVHLSRDSSKESSTSRPSNKIVVLKPIPRTVRCSENVSCHCSSMQFNCSPSSKGENVKRSSFSLKDIKRKLKYAMGEKMKENPRLTIAGSINSFTESNTKIEEENKQESISNEAPKVSCMTERVRKKLDAPSISYAKKQELDISMEAKRHLSQRLNYVSAAGEAVMSRQPPRTLERILSSPEHDLLSKKSSKQDRKSNYTERRCSDASITQSTLNGVQSPQRDQNHRHRSNSIMDSTSEVWSPGSSTDASSLSPCSIYKLKIVDNITDRGDHPSPVSVLEPVFADDLASPSSNTNQPSERVLRPRRIDFEGCLSNESRENHVLNSPEPDALCTYIESSLQTLRLNWEDLWISRPLSEQMLDATLSDELETLGLQCHSEPKLLMDYTSEVLLEVYDTHFRFPPWLSFVQPKIWSIPLEKHLAEKVLKEVKQHLVPVTEQRTLNEHAENDLAKCGLWFDVRKDAEDILTYITDDVLEESIMEIALQLHTSFLCS